MNIEVQEVDMDYATSNMQAEAFAYDAIANRTSDQAGGYGYDPKSQRLLQDYRNFYFYDNNGNLISKQAKGLTGEATQFTYSSENQLLGIKVYAPGTYDPSVLYATGSNLVKEVSYAYDALGRRISKKVIDHRAPTDPGKSFTRAYGYDQNSLILELNENNQILARYTYNPLGADDVLAVDVTSAGVATKVAQSPGSYQYLKDATGSIVWRPHGDSNPGLCRERFRWLHLSNKV